jgi:PAS domain S-box-containing protein
VDLHPGPESRRVLEVRADEIDPIRRALYLSEDWYQDLIQHSQDFLCMHDLEGRILSVNPAPARVLGYSIEELLQIPLRDILALQFRPQFDVYLRQLEETRESSGLMSVATRSGERRIWRYHSVLRSQGVPYPTVRVTAYDVTEQTSAERNCWPAVRKSRRQLKSRSVLFKNSNSFAPSSINPVMPLRSSIQTLCAISM